MTKSELIRAHIIKHPELANDDGVVSLKASTLKAMLEDAYTKGHREAERLLVSYKSLMDKIGKFTGS